MVESLYSLQTAVQKHLVLPEVLLHPESVELRSDESISATKVSKCSAARIWLAIWAHKVLPLVAVLIVLVDGSLNDKLNHCRLAWEDDRRSEKHLLDVWGHRGAGANPSCHRAKDREGYSLDRSLHTTWSRATQNGNFCWKLWHHKEGNYLSNYLLF